MSLLRTGENRPAGLAKPGQHWAYVQVNREFIEATGASREEAIENLIDKLCVRLAERS